MILKALSGAFRILVIALLIPLSVIFMPLALIFSIARLPFAHCRTINLNKIVANDWLSREKYIYLGYGDNLPITEFIEGDLLAKYGKHTIFDKWSSTENTWHCNEPDTYRRVTTIWQDLAHDFDGEPLLIVAVLTPQAKTLSETNVDVFHFIEDDNAFIFQDKNLSINDTKNLVLGSILDSLKKWQT